MTTVTLGPNDRLVMGYPRRDGRRSYKVWTPDAWNFYYAEGRCNDQPPLEWVGWTWRIKAVGHRLKDRDPTKLFCGVCTIYRQPHMSAGNRVFEFVLFPLHHPGQKCDGCEYRIEYDAHPDAKWRRRYKM